MIYFISLNVRDLKLKFASGNKCKAKMNHWYLNYWWINLIIGFVLTFCVATRLSEFWSSWVECKASASVWISNYIALPTPNKSSTSKLIQYLLLYMDINQRINWHHFTMAFHINSAQLKSSLPNGPALIHLFSNYGTQFVSFGFMKSKKLSPFCSLLNELPLTGWDFSEY